MENEYLKEIERLKEECRNWESNYIVERDNGIVLQAELDKYKKAIDEHNQEVLSFCINNTYCDPVYYGPHRGKRECPDCPRMWQIDMPSNKNPSDDS